jgi:hypothetical protein
LFQGLHQGGYQGLSVVRFWLGIAVSTLFEQPSHVVAVNQGDTATTAGLSMVLAGMRCAVFILHLGIPVGDVFKTKKVGHTQCPDELQALETNVAYCLQARY